jgi:hypothetical protein
MANRERWSDRISSRLAFHYLFLHDAWTTKNMLTGLQVMASFDFSKLTVETVSIAAHKKQTERKSFKR